MNALRDHLHLEATTTCRAWIITRKDGKVYGFTDHDKAIELEGVQCLASSGLSTGTLETGTGLSVDNGEFIGALSHKVVNTNDIRLGKWDEAFVRVYIVNWADQRESEIVFCGHIGEINSQDGKFFAEIRSQLQLLNRVRGRLYQATCDAVLGDRRCNVSLEKHFSIAGKIVEILGRSKVIVSLNRDEKDGYFASGKLKLIKNGTTFFLGEIKSDWRKQGIRTLSFWKPVKADLDVGDQIRAYAGCNKSFSMCVKRFDNATNYRGFPTIPGEDWLMKRPSN